MPLENWRRLLLGTGLLALAAVGGLLWWRRDGRSVPRPDGGAGESLAAPLPADARDAAERLAACSHFAGEFSGDRSDRDRQVTATMAGLRCEQIDADVEAIRRKYAGDRAIRAALDRGSQL